MRLTVFLVWMMAATCASAFANDNDEAARLAWTLERGRLLFEIDRAAWVSTDDMLGQVRDAATSGMRGYIVERDQSGFIVTFYGGPSDAPIAFYRGVVRERRVVSREVFVASSRPLLTAMQKRLAIARDRASSLGRRSCNGHPFNTAVIPPDAQDEPIDLYLLTPQVRGDEFPFGGHFRFTIAGDGSVLSDRPFTNSCLAMQVPPGERPAALGVSHLLDPIPTELHVFTAMTSGFPIMVGTNHPDRAWWVTGEEMRLIDR